MKSKKEIEVFLYQFQSQSSTYRVIVPKANALNNKLRKKIILCFP